MTQDSIVQKIELDSKLDSLLKLEGCVDDLCDMISISEDDYGNILIAITEAVNNAITHGNQLNPHKKVILNIEGTNKVIEFVVTDEGAGFDPDSVPDPTLPENIEKLSGRGIYLMRNLADEVEFQDNGTKIKLKFSLSVN